MNEVTKQLMSFAVRLFKLISHNFGKLHQDLPLLQLFEGLKMGIFLHKNVKTFDDGISCVKITQSYGCLLLFFCVEYIIQGIFG